jgi:uncharacterized membrane protein YccF (DUF307 family)
VRTVLNVIWLVFAGIWLAILYVVAGALVCLTIIGIPFGVAAFRMAGMALWPFGRQVVKKPEAGAGSTLGNILWFVLCGWWLALGHLLAAVALAVTIIGLPLAAGALKLVPVSINPFGREIVPTDEVRTALAASRRQG